MSVQTSIREEILADDMKSLMENVHMLEANIVRLGEQVSALGEVDPSTDVGKELSVMQSEVKEVAGRLGVLENSIMETPEKALSLPLLRRDLENLTKNHRKDVQDAIKSVDRIYDQNKWFLGIMITTAAGLFSLAISNLFQMRKKDE